MDIKYTTRNFIRCFLLAAAGVGCALKTNTVSANPSGKKKKIRARITYYTADSKYGTRVACPKTRNAVEGSTIAAHPDFKFGQKLSIPALIGQVGDGKFTVNDRGTAVTAQKASGGKGYVFDVYVSNKHKLLKLSKTAPMWMDVYVLP